jgi:hypothetical protein
LKSTVENFIVDKVEWTEVIKAMVASAEIPEPELLEVTDSSSFGTPQDLSVKVRVCIFFLL